MNESGTDSTLKKKRTTGLQIGTVIEGTPSLRDTVFLRGVEYSLKKE